MDKNAKLFLSYLSNVLTKVTEHLCLLNLNIYIFFVTKQSTKTGPTPS